MAQGDTRSMGAECVAFLREGAVPADGLGLWFLGQNGFLLRSAQGTTIAIDPYLTDSCVTRFPESPFDLGRCVPAFLQPEELEVDYYLLTHSHGDHLDEETIHRLRCKPLFLAPWEAYERLLALGVPRERCRLLHPNEVVALRDVRLQGTFALPTDGSDLNHIGLLLEFANGVRFYNTGDTAYAEAMMRLIPSGVDLCAICINGGFHNLSAGEAVRIVRAVAPRVTIPTHYDMMVCNRSDPEAFRIALQHDGVDTRLHVMPYDRPWIYRKEEA